MPIIPLPAGFKGTHKFPFIKKDASLQAPASPQASAPAQAAATARPGTPFSTSRQAIPGESAPHHLNDSHSGPSRSEVADPAAADRMDKQLGILRQRVKERKCDFEGMLGDGTTYTMRDRPNMEALVKGYNARYPGLNVHFADGLEQSVEKAMHALPGGRPGHARIVCFDGSWSHHTALDFRRHPDGMVTVVGVDSRYKPETKDDHWHEDMHAMTDAGKVKSGVMYYTDIQQSDHGCGIFALDFAKSMWKEEKAFDALHGEIRDAVDGKGGGKSHLKLVEGPDGALQPAVRFVESHEAFNHLPLRIGKNLQSTADLRELVRSYPDAATKPINKRQESIPERLERITGKDYLDNGVKVDHFDKNLPIDKTRIRMYEKGIGNSRGLPG